MSPDSVLTLARWDKGFIHFRNNNHVCNLKKLTPTGQTGKAVLLFYVKRRTSRPSLMKHPVDIKVQDNRQFIPTDIIWGSFRCNKGDLSVCNHGTAYTSLLSIFVHEFDLHNCLSECSKRIKTLDVWQQGLFKSVDSFGFKDPYYPAFFKPLNASKSNSLLFTCTFLKTRRLSYKVQPRHISISNILYIIYNILFLSSVVIHRKVYR